MAHILFYEKPGCANNRRQRDLLVASGHSLEVRDLLSTSWHQESLLPFLESTPISAWFNRASPRIKSGEIDPTTMDGDTAMALLITDPLLIRRPLIQVGDWRTAGFDPIELSFLLSQETSENPDTLNKMPPELCHRKTNCTTPPREQDS